MISGRKIVTLLKYIALVILSYLLSYYINYYILNSDNGKLSISISIIIIICIYKLFLKSIHYIKIDNKAVLVTGCDSGFGYNTALKLNEKGFRVYATVLNESTELIKNSKFEDQMIVIKMDVRDDDDIKNAYRHIYNDINENNYILWSVVNNAGVGQYCRCDWGSFESCFNIINVNLLGTIRVTRTFIPLILKSKGRIVNISSVNGCATFEDLSSYCTSKHGVQAFTNCLRLEMKKFGIIVSTIMPGPFKTSSFDQDILIKTLKTNWNNTDEDVKNIYGNEYFNQYLEIFSKKFENFPASSNIDMVSNDIIDAIINVKPKIIYKPIDNILVKIVYFIFQNFPYCISDILLDIIK